MREIKESLAGRIAGISGKVAAYIVMGVFAAMTIAPILWLVNNSFKSNAEYRVNKLGLPIQWAFVNYKGAWDVGEFGTLIGNSVLYTVVSTLGIIVFSVLAGFAFAKIRSRATSPIYGIFVMGILLSIQSVMVPLFIEVSQLDKLLGDFFQLVGLMKSTSFHLFYNTRFAMIIIYIGSGLPQAIYLSTEYIKGIPDALVEASRMDGAGYFTIFRSIILPMAVPIATTIAIINVPGLWNEFALVNIIIASTNLKSLPTGILRFSGVMMADWGKQFAALVIGMAPMIVFYVIFRKQITKGVSGGAVKG